MKIGIIGTGNLMEALIKILLKNRVVVGSNVAVYDTNMDKLNYWAGTYDVMPCTDMDSVIQDSQLLFIAVNKKSFEKLMPAASDIIKMYRPLVVSFTNGISLEETEDMADIITPMARVSTNVTVASGNGITAYCFNELVTDEQKGMLIEMLSTTGQLVEVDEQHFESFSAVIDIAALFACEVTSMVSASAVRQGLDKDMSLKAAIQSIHAATKLLVDGGEGLDSMIAKLSPPESMGVNGLLALKENGFDKAVIRGYRAATENNN